MNLITAELIEIVRDDNLEIPLEEYSMRIKEKTTIGDCDYAKTD